MARQCDAVGLLFSVIVTVGCLFCLCDGSVLSPPTRLVTTRRREHEEDNRRPSRRWRRSRSRHQGQKSTPISDDPERLESSDHCWSKQTSKQKLNQALLLLAGQGRPTRLAATLGISSVALNYLRHNGEATRRTVYFWRRVGPMVVHYQFARWWLGTTSATKDHRDHVYGSLHDRYCQPSLELILHLKGLYVKIGQVLSSRPDFVPIQYVELFSTVQDAIPPSPIEEVKQQAREALQTELGLQWEDVFESLDMEALGSASIGQVHRAVLKSPWETAGQYRGGKVVAVKVMSSGSQARFVHDFQVFRWLCRVALPGWKPFLQEMERQVMTEFDYRNEAASLDQVRNNMAKTRYARHIQIPQPVTNLCCKHLLVMEMLEGKKLAESIEDKLTHILGGDKNVAREFLTRKREGFSLKEEVATDSFDRDYLYAKHTKGPIRRWVSSTVGAARLLSLYRRTRHYVDLLVDVHGHQIFLDGCFNGDPHPGNCLELNNGKLGLIDYGQTRRLADEERFALARIVSGLGRSSVDTEAVAQSMRQCGFRTKYGKDDVMARYAALFFDSDIEAKRFGCATPQLYLLKLAAMDPLVIIPDPAVFVARTSFLFRGMGAMLDEQVRTSKRWRQHADAALMHDNAAAS